MKPAGGGVLALKSQTGLLGDLVEPDSRAGNQAVKRTGAKQRS
jgi:hypothetical protein